MRPGNDEGQHKLRDEIAKPDRCGLRQTDDADGDEPANAREQHAESEQVNKKTLFANCETRP